MRTKILVLLISIIVLFSGNAFALKSTVAVVNCKPTNIEKAVRKAMEMCGGIESKVRKWDRVIIKVSVDEARTQESGQVTNVEVVRALVRMCKEAGARRIVIADGSLKANTWKAFEVAGYSKMAREEGVVLKDLDSDQVWRAWLPEGEGYKKYSVATTILNSEVFINVPVMKDGDETSPSLALKNMLGVMDDKWAKRKLPKDDKLDELILDMNLIKQSDLVIIDGTRYGNVVIGSTDPVAADVVACKFMKIDPGKVKYIKMAADKGLGQDSPGDIDVKTVNL